MLQIRLLGQFDIRADGKRVLIASRSGQSLFAFLMLHAGVEHRREKLAGMIWPDTSDEIARKNLRQELWRIRKSTTAHLPANVEYLTADEITVALNADAPYWLDVAALEKSEENTEALISSLSLYRGELLPGFYDDWVMLERERVQGIFESKCAALLEKLIQAASWNKVQEWADRWIALGQTPEPAYRAQMIAAAALHDSAKLALAYERCVEALRNDLGVEPSPETRALFDELSQGKQLSQPLLAPISPIQIQPSGTVTFLFSDIEGSTRLVERLGEVYASVLSDQRDLLRAIAEKCNGHEVDTQGDSFFFAFFRAADAVAFAADAQRALASHPWPHGETLRVRMGLHTGEPMLARTGYVGIDVHRAARIGGAGHGGQVLLSQTTSALVENELPPGTELADLGEHRLKDLRYPVHIIQLTIEGLPSEFPPLKSFEAADEPPAPGEPPFKGLEFFDEGDADLFFGREQLVVKLAASLREQRFLAVVIGASGSGKSSVVRAGLIPALRRGAGSVESGATSASEWRVFVMTPTAHPLEALATTLTRDSESVTATATLLDDLARDPRSLQLYLRRQTADSRWQIADSKPQPAISHTPSAISHSPSAIRHTLLLVDQFEELFTLCRDEFEREQFIDNLLDAVNITADERVGRTQLLTLVITLRADFYSQLAQYPELRDAVAKQQEYIGPMTVDELRRAMEEPARKQRAADGGAWEFEPGLVDLILRDVGQEPGALPLLSHALLETWKRRSGHRLTLKGYAESGGVRGAIAHTAESTYQQLSPAQQNIARNIFLRLTELGEATEDTRRRAEIRELEIGDLGRAQVRQVLTMLADARLITTSENSAEVAHEALIREWPRLREWLNENRDGLKLHRHLTEAAHDWELMERDASVLYRGARLAQAREFAATTPNVLNAGERAFLEASEENEKREEREREEQQKRELEAARTLAETQTRAAKQLRQRAVFLAGAFVLALLLAGIALFFGNRANENAVAAQDNAIAEQFARATAVANENVANERLALSEKQRIVAEGNIALNQNVFADLPALLALHVLKQGYFGPADGLLLRALERDYPRVSFRDHTDSVWSIDLSSDGKYAVTAASDKTFRLWDAKTGKEIRQFPGWVDVSGVEFSPDGKMIATSAEDIRLYDTETGNELRRFAPNQAGWEVVFSPDGKLLASGNFVDKTDGAVRLWDVATGNLVQTLQGHTQSVWRTAFSPDGKMLASSDLSGVVILWDLGTGKEIRRLGEAEGIGGVAFSPDGKFAVGASFNGKSIVMFEIPSGELVREFIGHARAPESVAFLPDGKHFVSTDDGGTARLWDVETGDTVREFRGYKGIVFGIDISNDGKYLALASIDLRFQAGIWELFPEAEPVVIGGQIIGDAVLSPDASLLLVGLDHAVGFYDPNTGKPVRDPLVLEGGNGVNGLAFTPDGKYFFGRRVFDVGHLWETATGKEVARFEGGKAGWRSDISPDGKYLVERSQEGMHLWDVKTGKLIREYIGITGDGYRVAFSPDGKYIASNTHEGNSASIWETETGKEIRQFVGHTNLVEGVDFSPDGKLLVTASQDGTLRLWDVATGQELHKFVGHVGAVFPVAFSPDGKFILSGGADRTARLWDVATGKEVRQFFGHEDGLNHLGFYPDGKRIYTQNDFGMIRIWTIDLKHAIDMACARLSRDLDAAEIEQYNLRDYQAPCGAK